jgi:hypothetical protein
MFKKGQIPLLKFGMQIAISTDELNHEEVEDDEFDKSVNSRKLDPPQNSPQNIALEPQTTIPISSTLQSSTTLSPSSKNENHLEQNIIKFFQIYGRSCRKLLVNMDKAGRRIFDHLPERFYRSAINNFTII